VDGRRRSGKGALQIIIEHQERCLSARTRREAATCRLLRRRQAGRRRRHPCPSSAPSLSLLSLLVAVPLATISAGMSQPSKTLYVNNLKWVVLSGAQRQARAAFGRARGLTSSRDVLLPPFLLSDKVKKPGASVFAWVSMPEVRLADMLVRRSVPLAELRQSLYQLFTPYGRIVDIVACKVCPLPHPGSRPRLCIACSPSCFSARATPADGQDTGSGLHRLQEPNGGDGSPARTRRRGLLWQASGPSLLSFTLLAYQRQLIAASNISRFS
jgi:hypothetical protein